MPQNAPFSISRVFNAPRELVFDVHTTAEHLAKWMSPAGFKVIKADLDLRPGGRYHYGLEGPDGSQMWGEQHYREVVRPERIVLVQSFSTPEGGPSRHPLSPTWPLRMLATTTFKEVAPKQTELTISWQPYEATEEEIATFEAGRGGMTQGFGGMFTNLEQYLATLG